MGRADQAAPGLYEEYMSMLRVITGRYGLRWRDYTNAMSPLDFRQPMFGEPYDAIHLNVAGGHKLVTHIVDAVQDQIAAVIRDRHGAP